MPSSGGGRPSGGPGEDDTSLGGGTASRGTRGGGNGGTDGGGGTGKDGCFPNGMIDCGDGEPGTYCAFVPVTMEPICVTMTPGGGATGLPPPPPIPVNPLDVVARLCANVTLPGGLVQMNPNLGLVNVPSWFWLDYRGHALSASETTAPPYEVVTVEIRVFPVEITWDWGDGKEPVVFGGGNEELATAQFGVPYPLESPVTHVYTTSSLRHPTGFPVRVPVIWAVDYRVNGGAWQRYGQTLSKIFEGNHRVQEAQPLIVR